MKTPAILFLCGALVGCVSPQQAAMQMSTAELCYEAIYGRQWSEHGDELRRRGIKNCPKEAIQIGAQQAGARAVADKAGMAELANSFSNTVNAVAESRNPKAQPTVTCTTMPTGTSTTTTCR